MNQRLPIKPAVTDYLSVSRIQAFVRCPKQYALKYVERAPAEFLPIYFAGGRAFHSAIGEHLARSGAITTAELVEVFTQTLDRELSKDGIPVLFQDDETRDDLIKTARQMIEAFQDKVPMPDRVLDIERSFSLELAHPVTGEILPVPIVGAIDAIVEKQGEIVVWEIKTAKRKWGVDQLEWDLQTTAYLRAARELGHREPGAEVIVTTKAKKPDVQVERLVRHRRDEQELADLAFGVLSAIEAGVDYRVRGWQCRTCQWAGSCSP